MSRKAILWSVAVAAIVLIGIPLLVRFVVGQVHQANREIEKQEWVQKELAKARQTLAELERNEQVLKDGPEKFKGRPSEFQTIKQMWDGGDAKYLELTRDWIATLEKMQR